MSDYWHDVQQARSFAEMADYRERERMKRSGLTEQDKFNAGDEIISLWQDFDAQTSQEQLRRLERMLECAGIRGWYRDPDPAFDLIALRNLHTDIDDLRQQLKLV